METAEMATPGGAPNTGRRRGRRLAAGAATLVGVLGMAMTLGGTQAHAATTAGNTVVGVYTIGNIMQPGMVVDITGGSTSWLTPVESWPSDNNENQKWRFVQVNPDTSPRVGMMNVSTGAITWTNAYQIVSQPYSGGSPECLEAEGSDPTAGDAVEMYGCNPNAVDQPNQVWYPITVNGQTQLVNGISAQNTNTFYQLANGDIQTTYNSATAQNALVLTPVGELKGESTQGNQLVLEPSDFDGYLRWQRWAVDPTEYAVTAPTVTVNASSTVGNNYFYGCLNNWAPQVSDVNGDYQLNYQSFISISSLYVDALPDVSSQGGLWDIVGMGEWEVQGDDVYYMGAAATEEGVEVQYYNWNVVKGTASIRFYCLPSGAGQLTG